MSNKIKEISTSYVPRHHQQQLHDKVKRFSCLVAHRRFGKGVWSANELIDRALRCHRPDPQMCHISPYISQAKRNMWGIFKKYCRDIPNVKFNENELKIIIPRREDEIKIQLFGGDDPDAIRGQYFDYVILDEAAQINPDVWKEGVRPALSDRDGWCTFIGTPKGKNFFYHVYMKFKDQMEKGNPYYYSALFKASETGIIKPSELADAKMQLDEMTYLQEYECSFETANVGSYYGKIIKDLENSKKITDVPWDPNAQVITSWDLGVDDTTVIWFIQAVGAEFRVFDYAEDNGKGMPEYAKLLKEKPYSYERHIFPWDVQVKELGTGKTRKDTFQNLGVKPLEVAKKLPIADGINAVRNILPRCVFDKTKCHRGLEGLKEYQKTWDPKKMTFDDHPLHDWSSNSADSFRTFAVGIRENRVDQSRLIREAETDWDPFSV